MTDILISSPLLTVFVVVALGAALGQVPFGPLRFGAAGALFVGLAVGALVPDVGPMLGLVQSLGLALFVYMVGIAAGQTFFADLKRQAPLMGVALVALVIGAGVAIGLGALANVESDILAGLYSGSLTATPALAAAQDITGNSQPGVGYALGYPAGVVLAIVVVAAVVGKKWPGKNDTEPMAGEDLFAATAFVDNAMPVRSVPGWADQRIRMSYLKRRGRVRVISPGEELEEGDEVLVVGLRPDVKKAIETLGSKQDVHLGDYRADVDFRHVVISNDQLAGHSVDELDLPGRFGAVITRIRRGDMEMLARDDVPLELGDRVLVVAPTEEFSAVTKFLGDSERRVSGFDALSVGVGMALGLLLGLVEITLPGGGTFALGTAAGPLIVGMILGGLHRTGPLVWQLPQAANQTIRQLGLLMFLAAVGLVSGPAFAESAFTLDGLVSMGIGAAIVLTVALVITVGGRLLGLSAERTAGSVAGLVGQPAILSYATSRKDDERIEAGYAALFALGIVVKIVVVSLIVSI